MDHREHQSHSGVDPPHAQQGQVERALQVVVGHLGDQPADLVAHRARLRH